MPEKEFVRSMIEVASKLKRGQVTEQEKQRIIEAFNKKSGSAYDRARSAIEEVIGRGLQEDLILEKAASLNNLQNLLAQMNAAANNWQQHKEK